MIGRRAFTLGLGTSLLAAAPLGRALAERRKPIREMPYIPFEQVPNHRAMMREMIGQVSTYCRRHAPQLTVMVRNAPELIVKGKREWQWQIWNDPEADKAGAITPIGSIDKDYLALVDGLLVDGMFSGGERYGEATGPDRHALLLAAAKGARAEGKTVLSIEYEPGQEMTDAILRQSRADGFLTWIDRSGNERLARIPKEIPTGENAEQIGSLSTARNFLPMLTADGFKSRQDWVAALYDTNYDLLVLDAFWNDLVPLTYADLARLKQKKTGARRLVLADLPLGRARESAYYWKPDWREDNPSWLVARDPAQAGHWLVSYWDKGWEAVVGAHIQAAVKLGFDGFLLDQADSYLLFEDMMPID